MLGLLKYPDDFSKAQGLNQLWYKDTATTEAKVDHNRFAARHAYLIQSPTVNGTFSCRIPLIGFCEDYDRIVYGLKYSLTLVRKTDDDVIFRGAAAGAEKVSLDKISWLGLRYSVIYTLYPLYTLFWLMLKSFPFIRLLNQKLSYHSIQNETM